MTGKATVRVVAGARVARGDIVATLEVMKMEHRVAAPIAGRVSEVHVGAETQVALGAVLLRIVAESSEPA